MMAFSLASPTRLSRRVASYVAGMCSPTSTQRARSNRSIWCIAFSDRSMRLQNGVPSINSLPSTPNASIPAIESQIGPGYATHRIKAGANSARRPWKSLCRNARRAPSAGSKSLSCHYAMSHAYC